MFGHGGVDAFYKRSLHMAVADYSWLAEAEGAVPAGDFSSLHVVLSRQSGVCASAAHKAMVQIFNRILGNVIGRSVLDLLLMPPRASE